MAMANAMPTREHASVRRPEKGSHVSTEFARNAALDMVSVTATMVCANARSRGREWHVTRGSAPISAVAMGHVKTLEYAPATKAFTRRTAQRKNVQMTAVGESAAYVMTKLANANVRNHRTAQTVASLNAPRIAMDMEPVTQTRGSVSALKDMKSTTVQMRFVPNDALELVNATRKQENVNVTKDLLGQIVPPNSVPRIAVAMESVTRRQEPAPARHHTMARTVHCYTARA